MVISLSNHLVIYPMVQICTNIDMDEYDYRLLNVQALIDNWFHGKQKLFAEAAGVVPGSVSRWYMDKTNTNRRPIGEKLARKIERSLRAQGYKIKTGDLDKKPTLRVAEVIPFYETNERRTEAAKLEEMRSDIIDRCETLSPSDLAKVWEIVRVFDAEEPDGETPDNNS